jgi:protein gp37
MTTGISWTGETWNPVIGCSLVSEGCRHCYAMHQAHRIVRMGRGAADSYRGLTVLRGDPPEPKWTGEVRFIAERLAIPLGWKRPRRVFVNSMSDLFHDGLTNEQIAAVFGVMAACQHHTFQILTKRAKRMREWFRWVESQLIGEQPMRPSAVCCEQTDKAWPGGGMDIAEYRRRRWTSTPIQWPLPNVWLGVSVENQAAADERIPDLLATPAAVRFLSCEPLLGPLELRRYLAGAGARRVMEQYPCDPATIPAHLKPPPELHWVIAGCESGPGARACDVDWLRSLRDQCARVGVPIFVKQARPWDEGRTTVVAAGVGFGDGSKRKAGDVIELPYLDGVQHAAFPEVRNG